MSIEHTPSAERNSYEKYRSAGGFLNEKDYADALAEARDRKTVNPHSLEQQQAQVMADETGIVLKNRHEGIDPRVALYEVLRTATNGDPQERNHYSWKDDWSLFAEVLRILGDAKSLEKFLKAHPNIFPEGK
ncbi:MAG: hypothetical protein Q8O46_01605 [bacterium]|nr:hypothetical protein [bacterium]